MADDEAHDAHDPDEEAEEYETEQSVSRTEAAAALHAVADGVLAGAVRLGEDDDAVAVDVPESVSLEVDVEADDDEVELEVELEWPAPEAESAVSSLEEHPDAEEPTAAELGNQEPDSEEAEADRETADEDAAEADEATADPPMPVGAVEPVESLAGFEVFADRAGEWRWRLRHRNGNVIATGGEGYTRKHNAWKGLRSVMRNAPGATVTEQGDAENE